MSQRIIGFGKKMTEVKETIQRVSRHDIPVLIQGETGTGKELVAREIHAMSKRSNYPFVAINCAALTESIIESELFGHEKGAFTDAHQQKTGKFGQAYRGTLFLDEIGSLGYRMQSKLLRVLQEKSYERVGGNDPIKSDVRVISATNAVLEENILKGSFRSDLFHRISTSIIDLPPLRDRKEDIEELIKFFVEKWRHEMESPLVTFDKKTVLEIKNMDWPGNIRQLENCIIRILTLCSGRKTGDSIVFSLDSISQDDYIRRYIGIDKTSQGVDVKADPRYYSNMGFKEAKNAFEKQLIVEALNINNWQLISTAKYLGISRNTITNKMHALDIQR